MIDYTIVSERDLTDYVKSQTIKLNPSKKIYTPENIVEAVIAIDAKDVPAMGYVQYQLDLTKDSN